MNNDRPRRFVGSLEQKTEDTSLTVSVKEIVSFGYGERSLHTYGTVMVIKLYKMNARFI